MSRRRSKPTPPTVNPNKPSTAEDPVPVNSAPDASANPHADATRVEASGNVSVNRPLAPKPSLFPRLPSLSRIMSVVMLVIGIFAVGLLFYRVMSGFFVPLFLAALLVVIFRPVHEWIYLRIGCKPRIASLLTTTLVLFIVLLPLLLVFSVAASQFTAMLSQLNFNNVTQAIDRVREQFSLSLPEANQFRRLDELADAFDETADPEKTTGQINEAIQLIHFLEKEVDGPPAAEPLADIAEENLTRFADHLLLLQAAAASESTFEDQFDMQFRFQEQAVIAGASIRSWMHTFLGGNVWSQLRLIANPSQADFANLVRQSREALQPRFVQLTSATGGFALQLIIGIGILIIAVYFFLIDGPAMVRTLMRLSPLDDEYERQLLLEFDRTSRAVVLASVLSAVAQGILAAAGYYVAGMQSIVLLFLITTMMSLVPFLGAASVWAPCVLWLGAVEQRWEAAIGLALYGAIAISSIDNVIKVFVLHGRSQLHPLFALLSVLGGVRVFGPIGILVGPMVVVFLQTLLEILNHELASPSNRSREADPNLATPSPASIATTETAAAP